MPTKKFFLILVLSLFFPLAGRAAETEGPPAAFVYFNEACADCGIYLRQELAPFLEGRGYRVDWRDYLNEKQARRELNDWNQKLGIPFELQSHIMVFLDGGRTVFGGHAPVALADEVLEKRGEIGEETLLIFQDLMLGSHGTPQGAEYTVWTSAGRIKSWPMNAAFAEHLKWRQDNQSVNQSLKNKSILSLVLVSGFLDGFNPCAFAVLIFFMAFLFALRRRLRAIFGLGILYIAVIYLTYLGIGLGLFKAIVISSAPHLMARVGALLLIVLSLFEIKDYFWPASPIHLRMPRFSQEKIKNWLTRATVPAIIVGAFLVGLCTFPCSGGIYVATIGLLAAKETYWRGLGYLLLYNVMFVVPLAALLLLAANRPVLAKVAQWQAGNDRRFKLLFGLVMLALGVAFLFV